MKKTVLVSGAGSGIGRAICETLASGETGARLILVGRNEGKLKETVAALPKGGEHLIAVADVSNQKELHAALAKLPWSSINLTGVVSNAGIGGGNAYGEGDRWNEVMSTNLNGTYYLVNEALPFLKASREKFKHVILISSILSKMGVPGYSAYCASKAALLGLTRVWANEWARDRILVNAICPGWVATDMAESGILQFAKGMKISYEEALALQMKSVPLGKMSEPQEIASVIRFLLSDAQVSITGQSIDVNNGALM